MTKKMRACPPGVAPCASTVSSCCTPASFCSSSLSSWAVPCVWPPLEIDAEVSLPETINSLRAQTDTLMYIPLWVQQQAHSSYSA